MKDRILLLDQTCNFIRMWISVPSLNSNGIPIGGIISSLLSLQKLVKEINPSMIVIVWDGTNGSKRRKQLYKNYKEGRSPIRFGKKNWAVNLSLQEQQENKSWQMSLLIDCLKYFPIYQFKIDETEADDVIAFVYNLFSENEKCIVSSDKDFIQLLDKNTILYRPVQQEILTIKKVVEKYGIHPCNFVLARAIAGDNSDCIKGVGSVGLATLAKWFPILREDKILLIADLIDMCKKTERKLKVHESIISKEEEINFNYNIMQLLWSQFSIQEQEKNKIRETFKNKKLTFNKFLLEKKLLESGISGLDLDYLFTIFNRFIFEQKTIDTISFLQ